MSITINLVHEMEARLRRAARREGVSPDAYVAAILHRYMQEQASALHVAQAELLNQINIGLSEKDWQRYHTLRLKLANAPLGSDDQDELLAFTDRIEAANVQRIAALIQLAELRGTTLDALIDQLGIHPPAYA